MFAQVRKKCRLRAAGYIVETRAEGRRRSYQLTAEGETLLQNEVERLQAQVRDYEKLFER